MVNIGEEKIQRGRRKNKEEKNDEEKKRKKEVDWTFSHISRQNTISMQNDLK